MNELDSEELVMSFENIMTLFNDHLAPFATKICHHLSEQYKRLIKQDPDADDGESILTAVASLTSIRRILDAISEDEPLISQVENIIYPVILHTLTIDGLDSIEEGIDCITLLAHHGYKSSRPLSHNMWKLYPQLLYICAGNDGDEEGGYGFEQVTQICVALKNYVSRDPQGMLQVGEDQAKDHLSLMFHFFKRCLEVNRNSSNYLDGIGIMNLIIAILENMQGMIDNALPELLNFITSEITNLAGMSKPPENFKSICLQALSMAFAYNSTLTFQYLDQ